MNKKQQLSLIKKELEKLEVESDDEKYYLPAEILLASLVCGPNADRIAELLNEPRSKVRPYAKTIRKNGIWDRDKVCCEWFNKEYGGVAFLMDVNVAAGFMNRT